MATNTNQTGAVPAPQGYIVDLAHPIRDTAMLRKDVCAGYIGMAVAFTFLCQRMYTKAVLMRQIQVEDVCLIVSWMGTVAVQAITLHSAAVGVIGVHIWEVSLSKLQYGIELYVLASLVYGPTAALAKVTICLFYTRVSPVFSFRCIVWATLWIIVAGHAINFLLLLLACRPVTALWDLRLQRTHCTIDRNVIYLSQAAFGVASDILLLLLPIPMLSQLQAPLRYKAALMLMFAVGSITSVTSVVRLSLMSPVTQNLDRTWTASEGIFWIYIEANLFIICASLLTMRVFLRHFAPRLIGESRPLPNPLKLFGSWGSHSIRTFGARSQRRRRGTLTELEHGPHGVDDPHGQHIPLPRLATPDCGRPISWVRWEGANNGPFATSSGAAAATTQPNREATTSPAVAARWARRWSFPLLSGRFARAGPTAEPGLELSGSGDRDDEDAILPLGFGSRTLLVAGEKSTRDTTVF